MPESSDSPRVTVDQFRPRITTRVKATEVSRARFPAVDAHNHFSDKFDVKWAVDVMDACNVRVFVDLSGWNGERIKRRLELLKSSYPERFAVFYSPDFARVAEPGFGDREARELAEAVRSGVQGLKIYKELGLRVRDSDGTLVHVDDARLDPIWQAAGELGVPVLIHVADPWAFFLPMDAANERYGQLCQYPDWHFYGADFPPLQQLLDERERIVERHPGTIFIGAHVGSEVEDLDQASRLLDRCPNYYVDMSAREADLGRQPRRAREFFLTYRDRILFGTDGGMGLDMYRSYFRFLETDDECYEYLWYPGNGFWPIAALDLPDEVLRKVYAANAERIIPGLTTQE